MYVAIEGLNVKWGGTIFKWGGARHHCPPLTTTLVNKNKYSATVDM